MCCTCDADRLIDAHLRGQTVTFTWADAPEVTLEVEAVGGKAENAPAKVRLRKQGNEWSAWLDTRDLAGTMSRLGTDVKWRWVDDDVRAWLTGAGKSPYLPMRGREVSP